MQTTNTSRITSNPKLPDKNTRIHFFFLCILWIFNSFKPEWTIPGLRIIAPLQTLSQLILLVLWVVYSYKKLDNPITRYLLYFLILMAVSSALARNNGPPRTIILGMFFLYITFLTTVTFANTKKRVFTLFNIFILGHLFIALRAIQDGGVIYGANLYRDQNIVALGMNILFPLAFLLGLSEKDWRKKIFFFASSIISLVTIVVANSRGGVVGLAAVLLFIWLKSPKNKFKSLFLILCVVLGLLMLAPKPFLNEMATMKQGSHESTAGSRIFFWKIAVREFLDHPVIGVGVVNYGIWLPDYVRHDDTMSDGSQLSGRTTAYGRVAHSIYFTLLAELGITGVILFTLMLFSFFKEVGFNQTSIKQSVSRRNAQETKIIIEDSTILELAKCHSLSLGLMAGMIGFLASGAFLSVLYFPQFWWLCTLGVTLGNCFKEIETSSSKNENNLL